MERRHWLQLITALAAGAPASGAQNPQPAAPQRVTQAMLDEALRVIGLDFPEPQRAMMLAAVNRNLAGHEQLRKIPVPLDTEPAFRFYPAPPRPRGPARFQPTRAPAGRTWQSLDELAFLPVTELAPLVRARRVTSAGLTKMYLERLKQYSPKLNCVITFTEDLAGEQAARADAEIRRGQYRGPLHGIPWGAKDLFATKGVPTTWGAEPYQKQVIDYDATVVERLRDAGAVLVAKLSMGALAQGGLWFGGMTRNPWNVEQSSSGSSAGSASATAAGLVGFSIGTETLGSIVSPCTVCHVTGLRPTYGRVSRHGAMGLCWTMDKIGPICRSVEDCALVLRAIAGSDGKDRSVVDAPLGWQPDAPLAALRIGFVEPAQPGEEQRKRFAESLDALRKAGAKPQPVKLPDFQAGPLRVILSSESAAAFDDLTRDGGVNQLRGQSPGDWPNSFRSSRLLPAVEYIRAQRARTLLIEAMEKFMADWDVIVTLGGGPLLLVTNLTGHPQMVVPCGFLNGRAQGLVFTGPLYREDLPMRVALAFERATDWHKMNPKLS
jgi:Asp-tRNA(Asn)/Glu-tRNA(Gln) amidotransferase A subunit family amidase